MPAEPQVRELLEIPDEFALAGHISVGYRADPWPQRLRRNPVAEFAFGERFGAALVTRGRTRRAAAGPQARSDRRAQLAPAS